MNNEVAITGIGIQSPNGSNKNDFWNNTINGVVATKKYQLTQGPFEEPIIAGVVESFHTDIKCYQYGRGAQMALDCTNQVLKDAGLNVSKMDPYKIGVIVGTTMGESGSCEDATKKTLTSKKVTYKNADPYCMARIISEKNDLRGVSCLLPSACASGNCAIGYGADLIRSGRQNAIIVGGVEPFSQVLYAGFKRMRMLTTDFCKPFDKNRKGIIVSEGCGLLLLERMEHAKKRGAQIYGKVMGCGLSADGYNPAAPEPTAEGGIYALKEALRLSNIFPEQVDYISAHGTGTKANDVAEATIIKAIFKSNSANVPVSSIKSMIGHTMGAASAIEAVLCALILQKGVIPPTVNYNDKDDMCDLDCVPNKSRKKDVNVIISNGYGFYGQNSSIVFSKCM